MTLDYYTYVNLPTPNMNQINEFIKYSLNHDKFYTSRFGNCRVDFPSDIVNQLKEIFPFEISDSGIYKNIPGWIYPIHKDFNRQFAMNMLINDINSDFEALCYSENKDSSFPILYVKNEWIMLNTKRWHSVKNNSKTITRFVISVGCSSINYFEMRTILQKLQQR